MSTWHFYPRLKTNFENKNKIKTAPKYSKKYATEKNDFNDFFRRQ